MFLTTPILFIIIIFGLVFFVIQKSLFLLLIILALNIFLTMLNGFLRGKWKQYIDVFLGGIYALILILLFVFFNWKILLVSFFIMLLVYYS